MSLPLDRLLVLDLTQFRSGPTCARQLADMGARVIKIEPVGDREADHARHGFDFQNLQRNKEALTLDLKQPAGLAVFRALVARADVVLENFRPDVKHRLGIDYAALATLNPRIILGSISGFGQSGPYRDRPGYDQIAQGLGGLMSVTGLPGQGPVRVGIPVADLTAGLFLAQGILLALLERERSGRGQWVHTSLLQAMVTMLDFQASRWLVGGEVPPQAGNDHPTGIPTGVFRTRDGHINIAAAGQKMFQRLADALGVPALTQDPRFRLPEDRSKNRAELTRELERTLGGRTSAEWVEILNAASVPSGPILDVRQVYEDPQVAHLGLAVPVEHPRLGTLRIQAPPVVLERTPGSVRTAAPDAGADTDTILGELGYSPDAIAGLRRDGVV